MSLRGRNVPAKKSTGGEDGRENTKRVIKDLDAWSYSKEQVRNPAKERKLKIKMSGDAEAGNLSLDRVPDDDDETTTQILCNKSTHFHASITWLQLYLVQVLYINKWQKYKRSTVSKSNSILILIQIIDTDCSHNGSILFIKFCS